MIKHFIAAMVVLFSLSSAEAMYDPNYPLEDSPGCEMGREEMNQLDALWFGERELAQEGKFSFTLGVGFDDPTPVAPVGGNPGTTRGEQRLNALLEAARLVDEFLPGDVTIDASVQFFAYSSAGILASAGVSTYYYGQDTSEFGKVGVLYPAALARQLMTPPPTGNTFGVSFNSTRDTLSSGKWYYGFDQQGGSDIDFITVAIHEIVHGLGSTTAFNRVTGEVGSLGRFNIYSTQLEDHASGKFFPSITAGERLTAGTSVTGMHFVGPYTDGWAALNPNNDGIIGGHVAIYAPEVVRSGSSYVHPSNLFNPRNLMEPFYPGPTHNTDLVEAILLDAGWSEVLDTTPTSTTTTTLPPAPMCEHSDSNCDGEFNVVDVLIQLRESVGIESNCPMCTNR
jgi:hypothetical protein